MSTSQLEHLISKVIDDEASSSQWNELTELAENNPQVWRDLADTLRDHQSFSRGVNAAVSEADNIPIPENVVEPSYDLAPEDPALRPRRLGHWGGWAVAAMITIAWAGGFDGAGSINNAEKAGFNVPNLTAAQYLDKYKEQGRKEGFLYDELPDKVMIFSKPAASGQGFEILYLRQFVEKITVRDLQQFGSFDEQGNPTLIPVTNLRNVTFN